MLIEAILEKFGAILAFHYRLVIIVNVFINNLVVALIVLIFSLIPLLSLVIILVTASLLVCSWIYMASKYLDGSFAAG